MDLQKMAVQMLMEKLGAKDENAAGSALESLLGSSDGAGMDLGGLIEKFSGGDLGGALASWLGDGDNEAVGAEQITSALGADQIEKFAAGLGVGKDEASNALSSILPQLIDSNSSGGSLLGSAADLASKFFK